MPAAPSPETDPARLDAQARDHETFRALFDHSSDAYLIYDDDTGIVDCNRAAVAMLRYPDREAMIGCRPRDFSPEFQPCGRPSADKAREVIAAARRDGVCRFDWTHRRADGTDLPTQVTLTPIELHGRAALLVVWHDLTERKRAEDELRYQAALLRSLTESGPDGILVVDPDDRILSVNRRFFDIWRIPAELAGGGVDAPVLAAAVSRTADPDRFRARVQEIYAHPDLVTAEEVALADGRVLERHSGPVRGADGRRYGRVWYFRDVTARKRAEEAVRASEGRFRGAFDNAPIGMALVAPDGRWLKVNRAVSGILGYTELELLATDFQTLTHPDDLGADLDLVRQILAGEIDSYQMEKRYIHKCGAVVHALLAVSLVRDEGGRPLYFISHVKDITARKRAETGLRESEAKFRNLVDGMADGVFLVDAASRRVLEANPAAVRLFGYSADELAAVTLYDLCTHDRASSDANCERVLREGRVAVGRRQYRHKDGSPLHLDLSASVITLDDRPAFTVVFRDVSGQMAAEERLFRYQDELERANAQLHALATTDGLTGVKNRSAFDDLLAEEFDRAVRYAHPLSVVLLDVDHFKPFNDAFGHPAGDGVLRRVAGLLQNTVRGADVVARYGGEEFAVILPETDAAGAVVLAERCRRAVAGASWDRRPITVSVGVSTLTPDTADAAALVKEADDALYRSKHAGRNRVSHGSAAVTPPPARTLPVG